MVLMAQSAQAQDDDLRALDVADQAAADGSAAAKPSAWRGVAEAAFAKSCGLDRTCSGVNKRWSIDVGHDQAIVPGLRAVLESRLDVNSRPQLGFGKQTFTLKEAYLAWAPEPRWTLEAGRINVRQGVATGYNPTDFFRARALRTMVSVDPAATKANRLGTVALRSQGVWRTGAWSALFSPKLREEASDAPFSADLGSTNDRNRVLLTLSQRIGPELSPQWLYYHEEGGRPQFGMNLSWAPHRTVVTYLEWRGGRQRNALDVSGGIDRGTAFRSQSTAGLTLSLAADLTVTAEYHTNGAAPQRDGWRNLARSNPRAMRSHLAWSRDQQELPTRRALFGMARWKNILVRHLDFSALVRFNLDDRSHMGWMELMYHWDETDLGVQWQTNKGGPYSEFGVVPPSEAWQLLLRRHF
jgi:hypothetical protein